MMRAFIWFLLSISLFGQAGNRSQFGATYQNYLLASFEADWSPVGGGAFREYFSPDLEAFYMPGQWNGASTFPIYDCLGNLRDPSIIKSSVTGSPVYYLAHTGNCASLSATIGLSSSADGLTWANSVPFNCATAIPGTQLCWAPEWFSDPNAAGLGSLHVFLSASPNSSCCAGFQMWEMHPTANDFITNVASWSIPIPITVTGETAIIDPFVVWRSDTSLYYMWYAYKGAGNNCISYASSATLGGPYTDVNTNNCYGIAANFVEGPLAIQSVAGSPGTWVVCADWFQNTFTLGQLYCMTSTDGWSTWSAGHRIITPLQAKHGTIIPYP